MLIKIFANKTEKLTEHLYMFPFKRHYINYDNKYNYN